MILHRNINKAEIYLNILMGIGSLLGGGIVTYVVIFFGFIILVFVGRLFLGFAGIGKKSMDSASSKTQGLLSGIFSRDKKSQDHCRTEEAQESEAGQHLGAANGIANNILGQLNTITQSKDFNPDRVQTIKSELETLKDQVNQEAQIYHSLIEEYSADVSTAKKDFSDIKTILDMEGQLIEQDNKMINELKRENNQSPNLGTVLSLTAQLRQSVKEIKDLLAIEISVVRSLINTSESSESTTRSIFSIFTSCETLLNSSAPLTKVQDLDTNIKRIQERLAQLNGLNQQGRTQIQRRIEIAEKVSQLISQILGHAQERDSKLKIAEAELNSLRGHGGTAVKP